MAPRIYALGLLALVACDDGDAAADRQLSTAVRPFASCDGDVSAQRPLRCTTAESERATVLAVCGDLTAHNTLTVERSTLADTGAWVQGATHSSAPITIEGDLWTRSNDPTNTQDIGGAIETGRPLDCQAAPRVETLLVGEPSVPERSEFPDEDDVDDDDALGGDAVRISEPTRLDLEPCRYTHSNLEVDNTLNVRVLGHVTWVVTGDVRIAAPVVITLEEGASLDLVVGGSLALDNTLTVGDPAHPEATLVAVGGSIRVAAPAEIHGSLYAPDSPVAADNRLTVDGAAYVGATRIAAPMVVGGAEAFSERGCLL